MTGFRQLGYRKVVAAIAVCVLVVGAGLLIAQDQETLRIRTGVAVQDPRYPEYLARLLGHPLTTGNSHLVHTNGDRAFPAMLSAIERAATRISLETYIFADDETGKRFVDALEGAGRRGVVVHLVLDAVGAGSMAEADIERLKDAGVEVGRYNEVAGYSLEEANYRTHRKVLVVDGEVAFVGGMGFSNNWAVDAEDSPKWRDTQVELRGPVVDDVEAGFNENWIETGGVVEPQVHAAGGPAAGSGSSIVVRSSPQGGANSLKLLYLLAIAGARQAIDIQSPYVVTDESTMWSLNDARRRGVRIRILMEGDMTDAKPVKFAGRAAYETLLRQGIELYEYQPAMMHAKAMLVDGALSIVGSANFDNRSLELNDELNVAVFDRVFAARLLADFESDRQRSARIDLEQWRSRPLHIRWREQGWSLFGELF